MLHALTSSYALSIITALFSSGIIWGLLQWWMQQQMRKTQRDKDRAELDKHRRDEEQAAKDREELLAQAQSTAQRTALDSADKRYGALQEDYRVMRSDLRGLRESNSLLINAFEGFLLRMQPAEDGKSYQVIIAADEIVIARSTIMEARRLLF